MVGVQTQIGHVHSVLVGVAIVLVHREVQGLCRQFGVEFAGFAIESWASVVVYAVSDVGGLLHLCQQYTFADGMDTASGEVEDIAGMHFVLGQSIHDGAICHFAGILLGGELLLESRVDKRFWLSVDDVPHLRFAAFAMHTVRHIIVGVDLHAKVICCVNEFDEDGQLVIVLLSDGLAEHGFGHLAYHLIQGIASPCAVGDDGRGVGDARDFPALADMVLSWEFFPCGEINASPHFSV